MLRDLSCSHSCDNDPSVAKKKQYGHCLKETYVTYINLGPTIKTRKETAWNVDMNFTERSCWQPSKRYYGFLSAILGDSHIYCECPKAMKCQTVFAPRTGPVRPLTGATRVSSGLCNPSIAPGVPVAPQRTWLTMDSWCSWYFVDLWSILCWLP